MKPTSIRVRKWMQASRGADPKRFCILTVSFDLLGRSGLSCPTTVFRSWSLRLFSITVTSVVCACTSFM